MQCGPSEAFAPCTYASAWMGFSFTYARGMHDGFAGGCDLRMLDRSYRVAKSSRVYIKQVYEASQHVKSSHEIRSGRLPKSSQAKPSQAKPSQVKSSQVKSSQVKSDLTCMQCPNRRHGRTVERRPCEPTRSHAFALPSSLQRHTLVTSLSQACHTQPLLRRQHT